jgi:Lon protease-like protein
MSDLQPSSFEPADLPRHAALFPLPNAVFFPHAIFPLHIFEPRYRKMTADALDGNRLIAMALLKPGWERLSEDQIPPVCDMVCLSRITAEEKLPDGRYYLVLQGLSRARILNELTTDLPYRVGELLHCRETLEGLSESEDHRIREQLLRQIQSLNPELAVSPMFVQALDRDLPLGVFCDVLAHALRFPPLQAQGMLEELDVRRRSELLLDAMRAEASRREAVPLHYPPKFSRN